MVQFISPYVPPPTYRFPVREEAVAGLLKSGSTMKSMLVERSDALIKPIEIHARGVVASIESASGVKVGDVMQVAGAIAAISKSGNISATMAAVQDLIAGTLAIVTNVAKIAGVAGDALSMIPLVGQAAGEILKAIIGAVFSKEIYQAAKQKCHDELMEETVIPACRKLADDSRLVATDEQGAVPSDAFRPLAYALNPRGGWLAAPRFPICLASVYAAICGTEARGLYLPTSLGGRIPAATRRRMWLLIEAINAAVEHPLLPPIGTGGGRAAYPLLQAIVYEEYRSGRLTSNDVFDAAGYVAGGYSYRKNCGIAYPNPQAVFATESCSPVMTETLGNAFFEQFKGFKNHFYGDKFFDAARGAWRVAPAKTSMTESGAIVLAPKFQARGVLAINAGSPAAQTFLEKHASPVSVAMLSVLGGAAAFYALRK